MAEGIETQTQLEIARSFGTQLGQGYYFSKPLSAEALRAMLAKLPEERAAGLRLAN